LWYNTFSPLSPLSLQAALRPKMKEEKEEKARDFLNSNHSTGGGMMGGGMGGGGMGGGGGDMGGGGMGGGGMGGGGMGGGGISGGMGLPPAQTFASKVLLRKKQYASLDEAIKKPAHEEKLEERKVGLGVNQLPKDDVPTCFIDGVGFSIRGLADGALHFRGKVYSVSDVKGNTELMDEGSLVQVLLYGRGYTTEYVNVVHQSRRGDALSMLRTQDHADFVQQHLLQEMQSLITGLVRDPKTCVAAFYAADAIKARRDVLAAHVDSCEMPNLAGLCVPELVELQARTQEAASVGISQLLYPDSPELERTQYKRWSRFLCVAPPTRAEEEALLEAKITDDGWQQIPVGRKKKKGSSRR
jgi:hypothetical protein